MLLCKRCQTAGTVLRRLELTPLARAASSSPAAIPTPKPVSAASKSASSRDEAPRSRRYLKRRASSPSKALIAAIEAANESHALPIRRRGVDKLDISYFNPRTADATRWLEERKRETGQFGRRAAAPRSSLQTILAQYISHKTSSSGEPFTLNHKDKEMLQKRGYTLADMDAWASIVTAQDSCLGAREMLKHTDAFQTDLQAKTPTYKTPLPAFVFLYFLRRTVIHPKALRDLIAYSWWIIKQRQAQADKQALYPPMDDSSCFIVAVRLIRHARNTLPEAMSSIARFFIQFMNQTEEWASQARPFEEPHRRIAHNTNLYNKVLCLLSIPSSAHSFLHAPIHQRAQFECLRSMAEHNPPMCINREGYRAITRVQLANRKTPQERDWARLKAKSWPPWKQDRTGLDAEKGREYGTSRALEALQRGIEAGYGSSRWENAAKILSGWDVDGSPTIQTRAMLLEWKNIPDVGDEASLNDASIWTSRIRATRTLPEAWAAFLGWKERQLPPNASVYFFMLQKIAAESKRLETRPSSRQLSQDVAVLPGDGLELEAPPASDSEGIYVREAPPTFDALAEEMHLSGVFPGNQTRLAFLISHASSFEDRVKYLQWASEKDMPLLALSQDDWDPEELRKVNVRVLSAFVKALCESARERAASPHDDGGRFVRPLHRAMRLVAAYKPHYPQAWHVILATLAEDGPIYELPYRGSHVSLWKLMRDVYEQMRSLGLPNSAPVVLAMCRRLESVVRLVQLDNGLNDFEANRGQSSFHDDEANQIVASGAPFIRAQLRDLYGSLRVANLASKARERVKHAPDADSTAHPASLQQSPDLSLLHAYLRLQGFLGAWQELLATVKWMAAHRKDIDAVRDELSNGPAMLRRCIAAVRVLCGDYTSEQAVQLNDATASGDKKTASRRIRAILKQTIDEAEGWGGWPSDSECLDYVNGENEMKRAKA